MQHLGRFRSEQSFEKALAFPYSSLFFATAYLKRWPFHSSTFSFHSFLFLYFCFSSSNFYEAQWPIGYGVGLRIKRSSVRIRPWPAALSPWTRLFTPIVPRRSLHISFYWLSGHPCKIYTGKKEKKNSRWNVRHESMNFWGTLFLDNHCHHLENHCPTVLVYWLAEILSLRHIKGLSGWLLFFFLGGGCFLFFFSMT